MKTPTQKASCQGRDEGKEAMTSYSREGWLGLAGPESCGGSVLGTGDVGRVLHAPLPLSALYQSPGDGVGQGGVEAKPRKGQYVPTAGASYILSCRE